MIRKPQIDRSVSAELGLPLKEVARITRAFIDRVGLGLAADGEVELHNFAVLQVRRVRGYAGCAKAKYPDKKLDKIFVRFRKKPFLKERLEKAYKNEEGG